jgi:mRNA-degrading endonuclease RelE of RelBE toxin-antitoxin system
MSYRFYFASSFRRSLKSLEKKYPHVKADTKTALRVLEHSPQLGDVIPGSGGIRKLRIPNSDAARGKSGGYRLLYVIRPDRELIGLLLLYAKSERSDVTRVELIDLLRSLSQDLGERFIHEEHTEYEHQSNE